MPEATDQDNTLAPRIVRVTPISVTLHQPGKTRRAPPRVITGRLLAKVYRGDAIHHYRVAGDDGVLYLAPPDWLATGQGTEHPPVPQYAALIAQIDELIAGYRALAEPVA